MQQPRHLSVALYHPNERKAPKNNANGNFLNRAVKPNTANTNRRLAIDNESLTEKIAWTVGIGVVVILTIIGGAYLGIRNQENKRAESYAFTGSLDGSHPEYENRLKTYYFSPRENENLIEMAAKYMPNVYRRTYRIGDERIMVEHLTDKKYTVKWGMFRQKIVRKE